MRPVKKTNRLDDIFESPITIRFTLRGVISLLVGVPALMVAAADSDNLSLWWMKLLAIVTVGLIVYWNARKD